MTGSAVAEEEIVAAEKLSASGDFATALVKHEENLGRALDDGTRTRILYGIVFCSARLNRDDVTNQALEALRQLPDATTACGFADLFRARAYIEIGREREALDLINGNLKLQFIDDAAFREWKYENLFILGHSLTRLARCTEALSAYARAREILPDGKFEIDVLIAESNCLMALGRYDESFEKASRALNGSDSELAALAMQYMAECRVLQGRVPAALRLYADLRKRLPCRLVDENRVQIGITNCMNYLEKQRPPSRSS